MTPFIIVKDVEKSFGGQPALQQVNFSIHQGEIVGLVGPNGSGKTTLIRLLNGVIAPDRGSITIDGRNPIRDGKAIRARCGTLTEEAGLYEELTAYQNLLFFSKLYHVEDRSRIEQLLKQLHLSEHQHKKVGTYSTGMKKRLQLAKVLLHQPDFLFLDEPTNGLDPEGIQLIMQVVRQINQTHRTTILICSHILSQLEYLCDRYLFIEKGRVIEQGTQKELAERYLNQIQLRVETTYTHPENRIETYQYRLLSSDEILFTLNNKKEASKVISLLTQVADVYSAEVMNRDLETLYFEVKKRYYG